MSGVAFRSLADEEGRLVATGEDQPADFAGSEAPDASQVAASVLETGSIDRRLTAIRATVAAAEISETADQAAIGRTVRIREDGMADAYRLVIPGTGDPASGSISVDSPLGSALVGSRPGDRVEYATPGGARTATVESVEEGAGTPF
jgi:transcription elongation factor GreA